MKLTVLQLPARWGDPEEALAEIDAMLGESPPGDLVLLPETCLTGYVSPLSDFDLTHFAEAIDGPTAQGLAALARDHHCTVVGPLVLRETLNVFNATLGFGPDGSRLFTYKKRHPWFPERWATPGTQPLPLVEIAGLKVTVCVCFDIHFVSEESAAQLDAADLLLFPSAWVEDLPAEFGEAAGPSREEILTGLAQKHRIAIANANWAPGVVTVAGQGGSSVRDASGRVLGRTDASRLDAEL